MNHLQVKHSESDIEGVGYSPSQMSQMLLVSGFQRSTHQGWPCQDHLETSV
jgi:hypothetical protein